MTVPSLKATSCPQANLVSDGDGRSCGTGLLRHRRQHGWTCPQPPRPPRLQGGLQVFHEFSNLPVQCKVNARIRVRATYMIFRVTFQTKKKKGRDFNGKRQTCSMRVIFSTLRYLHPSGKSATCVCDCGDAERLQRFLLRTSVVGHVVESGTAGGG